jgi:hypothetical protein
VPHPALTTGTSEPSSIARPCPVFDLLLHRIGTGDGKQSDSTAAPDEMRTPALRA